ncbi:hypothetical protein OAK16_04530 [Verrucomicrobia bacterium]|nr:hypothetical protein [Verrucomicrobiota bacterium]
MYCDYNTCKKEVDINTVAVSQPKSAYTMFNEDGLGMTRVGGGNDNIVNVCKSCGKSEYLWESIEARNLAVEQERKKKEEEKEHAKEHAKALRNKTTIDRKNNEKVDKSVMRFAIFAVIIVLFLMVFLNQCKELGNNP